MSLSICGVSTDSNGRELKDHGTAFFPISIYEDNISDTPVPWHWHDEFEILFVTEGGVSVSAGKSTIGLSEGDGFFINSGILHAVEKCGGQAGIIHSAVFHPRLVGGNADSVYWQDYVQPLISDAGLPYKLFDNSESWHKAALKGMKDAWTACLNGEPGFEFQVRDALSEFVFQLKKNNPAVTKRPSEKELRDNERLKGMLSFIQKHFTEQMTVSDISGAVLISESECMRCFNSTMGTSPIQYLKHLRIRRSAELLGATTDKVIDIALGCGFQDVSYYIKAFRQVYGLTPAEYRKKHMPEIYC